MKKIMGIVGTCLVLLAIASGCGGTTTKIDTEMGVSALVALADSHIESSVNAMEVLAMTQEVQSGDWDTMLGLLAEVDQNQIPGTRWFVLPDGSYSTVQLGKTTQNISDRAYFPEVMAGNETLGDLVVSKSTGKTSLVATVPVVSEGNVIGGLGTSMFLDDLSNLLADELELPDDMVFYAVTTDNEVALCSNTAMILQSNPVLPTNAVSKTSPLTGWSFTLGFTK